MSFVSLRRSLALLAATVALGTLVAAPVAAQSPAPSAAAGATVTVVATDFAFTGLPTSVPAGTALALDNQGADAHQLLVVRKNAGTTETWDELLAMSSDEIGDKVTLLGPISAAPGTSASGTIPLDVEGDHLALDLMPQGMTAIPSGAPAPDASFGPLHSTLGMRQEFAVTAAGTEMGPLPSAGPAASAPAAEARTIELTMTAALQITDATGAQVKEIPVTPGETITFKVTNTAGYAHNFYIGTDQALMNAQLDALVGIPDYSEGTQEFSWTVPADITGLKFGCVVPGHYQLMQGTFVPA